MRERADEAAARAGGSPGHLLVRVKPIYDISYLLPRERLRTMMHEGLSFAVSVRVPRINYGSINSRTGWMAPFAALEISPAGCRLIGG